MKIFVVEDDKILNESLSVLLKNYGFATETSFDFKNIINIIIESNSDLILLDLNLPYNDGHYICKEIRKKSSVPIIVVTSNNNDIDELTSLNFGADDFISKPFNTQVLLAHIDRVLSRYNNNEINIEYKGLILDKNKCIIKYNDKEENLTKNEIKILALLIKNKGKIVYRNEIMNELWQTDEFIDDNTLTVNVNRLRTKLSNIGLINFIETKRGLGYIV